MRHLQELVRPPQRRNLYSICRRLWALAFHLNWLFARCILFGRLGHSNARCTGARKPEVGRAEFLPLQLFRPLNPALAVFGHVDINTRASMSGKPKTPPDPSIPSRLCCLDQSGTSIFTQSGAAARKYQREINAGQVRWRPHRMHIANKMMFQVA